MSEIIKILNEFGKQTSLNVIYSVDFPAIAERIEALDKCNAKDVLLEYVNWFNLNYPDNYIPNSRIGIYLMTLPPPPKS